MNRRSFLAGLLATTAAVPLAKALPLEPEVVTGLDLAAGPDVTAFAYGGRGALQVTGRTLFVLPNMYRAARAAGVPYRMLTLYGDKPIPGPPLSQAVVDLARDILDAAPVPDTIWYDEATDFTPEQWDYMLRLQREEATHANRLPDRRT